MIFVWQEHEVGSNHKHEAGTNHKYMNQAQMVGT